MSRLRVPAVLAFGLIAGSGCDEGTMKPPQEDATSVCIRYCVQDPGASSNCPPGDCADDGACPIGCRPDPGKLYCIPDNTDAGVCPDPVVCIEPDGTCPAGCMPIG